MSIWSSPQAIPGTTHLTCGILLDIYGPPIANTAIATIILLMTALTRRKVKDPFFLKATSKSTLFGHELPQLVLQTLAFRNIILCINVGVLLPFVRVKKYIYIWVAKQKAVHAINNKKPFILSSVASIPKCNNYCFHKTSLFATGREKTKPVTPANAFKEPRGEIKIKINLDQIYRSTLISSCFCPSNKQYLQKMKGGCWDQIYFVTDGLSLTYSMGRCWKHNAGPSFVRLTSKVQPRTKREKKKKSGGFSRMQNGMTTQIWTIIF